MSERTGPEGRAGGRRRERPGAGARPWLWAGAALLAVNSAYLAVSDGPGWLHLVNILLHPLLGVGVAVAALLGRWRCGGSWRSAGALLLLAAAGGGGLSVVLGRSGVAGALVWGHAVLGLAGLVSLFVAAAPARSRSRFWKLGAASLTALVLGVALTHLARVRAGEEERLFVNLPVALSMAEAAQGGAEGSFYPSPARTGEGGLLPAAAFAEAEACGRCHAEEVAEWSASPHRFSGLDNPWYRRTFEAMRRDRGPVPARWCAGCHTPALLLSGLADRAPEEVAATPAARAGVSCTVCHGMTAVRDSTGQGGFELRIPTLHTLALGSSRWQRTLYDLYVRLDPGAHRAAYSRPLRDHAGTPEMCAACHAGYLTEELNGDGIMPYFDDYFLWRSSSTSGQGIGRSIVFPEPQTCVDCHMRRRDEAGAVGRSHRFAAANTALPAWQGDGRQLDAVTKVLTGGQVGVDLFALREVAAEGSDSPAPGEGVYAPLDRVSPVLPRGREVLLDAMVRNFGVGHGFPGGKLDLQDVWVELEGVAEDGRTFFVSGAAGEGAEPDPGVHRYGHRWVGADGSSIDHHDVWNARAVAWSRVVEPGDSDLIRFRLRVPESAGAALTLTVRLRHRALRPAFHRWVFASLDEEPPRLPVVTLAEETVTLPVATAGRSPLAPPSTSAPPASPPTPGEADRWRAYGLALLLRGDFRDAVAALRRAVELAPDDTMARVVLAWAARGARDLPLAWRTLEEALAREEERLAVGGADGEVWPELGRVRLSLGLMEVIDGSREKAFEHLRFCARHFPRDVSILRFLANQLFEEGDFEGAAELYRKVLALEPLDQRSHFGLMQSLTAVEQLEQAEVHRRIFTALRRDQEEAPVQRFFEAHPGEAADQRMGHVHRPLPPSGGGEERP